MTDNHHPGDPDAPPGVDLRRPSVARVYDYYLEGTANWAIDREFGDRALASFPLLRPIAKANRLFLHRAVRHLARQGVRQFVDIGAGVPTVGPTHQVADAVAPDTRVVYVDNEPVAVAHSHLVLDRFGDPDRHAAINADLRDPDEMWERIAATGVVDLDQPVALLMIAVLHVMQPDQDGNDIGAKSVARYRHLMVPGSYLAISHLTDEGVPDEVATKMAELKLMYDTSSSSSAIFRTREEIGALFGDFEVVPPGLSWTQDWHPEETLPTSPAVRFAAANESAIWAGVARKPA